MILLSFSAAQYKFNNHRWKDVVLPCRSGNAFGFASYFKTKIIEASALGSYRVMMFLRITLEDCILKLRSQEVVFSYGSIRL
jgi:hypothetical protein